MAFCGDWKTLNHTKTVETRHEPIRNEEGLIIQWMHDYRTIEMKTVMETFYGETSFTPVVGIPKPDVETVISDEYATTDTENNSGEHTKIYRTESSWHAITDDD